MVILYPAIWWGWAPSKKYIPLVEDPLGNLVMFLIPSVILGTAMAAETMRMTRTMMSETRSIPGCGADKAVTASRGNANAASSPD